MQLKNDLTSAKKSILQAASLLILGRDEQFNGHEIESIKERYGEGIIDAIEKFICAYDDSY